MGTFYTKFNVRIKGGTPGDSECWGKVGYSANGMQHAKRILKAGNRDPLNYASINRKIQLKLDPEFHEPSYTVDCYLTAYKNLDAIPEQEMYNFLGVIDLS